MEHSGMKSIWYFVGLVLLCMGLLVLIAGILDWVNPPESRKVLAETHPGIWWGGLMMAVGAVYFWKNRTAQRSVH